HYIALYSGRPDVRLDAQGDTARRIGGLNHVAVTVADLDAMEARVRAEGLTPFNHADYEPGRRFYFHDPDWIEYEVVSYA
ncbi:VOC family protein, partial [Thioclava sp. BHET1]